MPSARDSPARVRRRGSRASRPIACRRLSSRCFSVVARSVLELGGQDRRLGRRPAACGCRARRSGRAGRRARRGGLCAEATAVGDQQRREDRESHHRQPSYSSAQYSPWNGQNSSSSPIMLAFHSLPISSSGKRPGREVLDLDVELALLADHRVDLAELGLVEHAAGVGRRACRPRAARASRRRRRASPRGRARPCRAGAPRASRPRAAAAAPGPASRRPWPLHRRRRRPPARARRASGFAWSSSSRVSSASADVGRGIAPSRLARAISRALRRDLAGEPAQVLDERVRVRELLLLERVLSVDTAPTLRLAELRAEALPRAHDARRAVSRARAMPVIASDRRRNSGSRRSRASTSSIGSAPSASPCRPTSPPCS